MKTRLSTERATVTAASVAPEDLKCGDFVAVMAEVNEYPSYLWMEGLTADREAMMRVRSIPAGAGTPLKVKAICLPFVFVRSPAGQYETVDIRRAQLVRLDDNYSRTVWKCLRETPQRSSEKPVA